GFDRLDFRNIQRANRFYNFREGCAFGEQERKIAFDRREAGKRFVTACIFHSVICTVERTENELGKKNVLAEFEFVRNAARQLPCRAELVFSETNLPAFRGMQRLRSAVFPLETTGQCADSVKIALEIGERER